MFVAWWHQAITCYNIDLSSVRSSDINPRAISQKIAQPSTTKITYLKLHSNLWGLVIFSRTTRRQPWKPQPGRMISNCIILFSCYWKESHIFCGQVGNRGNSKCSSSASAAVYYLIMMTSLNGNIFRVVGPLWVESAGHRWIPLTKASDTELWCFLWSAPGQTVEKIIKKVVIWEAFMLVLTSL